MRKQCDNAVPIRRFSSSNVYNMSFFPERFCSRTSFGFEKQPRILTSLLMWIQCPDDRYWKLNMIYLSTCWGNRREIEHWGDLGVDGWIILGWISRRWNVGIMDWIGLARDRDRWRTLVSAVMNLRVPWNAGNFLTSCKPVSCSRRTLHNGVSKCISALILDTY